MTPPAPHPPPPATERFAPPTRLVIDTDPGVDDAFAIALAALDPHTTLAAVTTVYGNVGLAETTANTLRLLALCGREDVPVAAGAARPLVHPPGHRGAHVHGADGLSGRAATLPERVRGVERVHAVELIAEVLRTSQEPVTICPIGPLTNIALLLAMHPELVANIARIVIMGGALGAGNVTATAEFNIFSDPEAAHRVLADPAAPTVLVPMDLTHACAVGTGWLADLAASGPLGTALTDLTPDYVAHYRRVLGTDGLVLHDAVAVAEAIRPGTLSTTALPLAVECGFGPSRGTTVADRRPPPARAAEANAPVSTVDVAVGADYDALRAGLLAGLGRVSR